MDEKLLYWTLLVVVANCSLIPLTNAAAAKPVYCDLDKNLPVKVQSMDIDPNPVVRGKPATFTISATSNRTIAGGKISIDVLFYGLIVYTESHDLCTQTTCPIKQGSFVLTNSQSLPGFTPAGDYRLRLKMKDAVDKVLTCVYFNFKIVHDSLIAQI